MDSPPDTYDLAIAGSDMGLRFIPCRPGTKVPLVKWKTFQTESPTAEMYEAWFKGTRNNIAVLTNGMVLFDCDDPAKEDFITGYCGKTPWRVRSPRGGVHLGYRRRKGLDLANHVDVKGLKIDIRTDGGLAMLPPSVTSHGRYEWEGRLTAVQDLPVAKIGWMRERARHRAVRLLDDVSDPDVMVRRARGYLATIEGAISGRRGHDKTFRVACVLLLKFGLSMRQAWPLFQEWNEQCEPPWSDQELRHKLEDAAKNGGERCDGRGHRR